MTSLGITGPFVPIEKCKKMEKRGTLHKREKNNMHGCSLSKIKVNIFGFFIYILTILVCMCGEGWGGVEGMC